jgi:hypothetical protein
MIVVSDTHVKVREGRRSNQPSQPGDASRVSAIRMLSSDTAGADTSRAIPTCSFFKSMSCSGTVAWISEPETEGESA